MAKYVELGQSDNRDVDLLDVKLVKLLPETEQLVVEPTTKEQNFKPSVEKYFDDVKVGAIKTESATVKSKETAEKIYPTQDHYFDSIYVKALALEEVQVEPTTTPQNIGVGEGYDAIKSVKVNAVNPSDYYKPEESIAIEPKTNAQTFNAPSGKVYNSISVAAVTSAIDPNILSTNIRKGKTILGVVGNMEADKPDQEKVAYASTTGDVVVVADAGYELTKVTIPKVNVSEYVKEEVSLDVVPSETSQTLTPSGNQVYNKVNVGAIPSDYVGSSVTRISEQTYIPTIDDIEIQSNQFLSGKQTIKGDVNLVAENIAEGKEIFGILGTHQGGSVKFAELVQGNISEVTAQDLVDITTIRDDVFANLGIKSVEIPSNVTTIGDSAFANNEISSLTLNEGVTTIGDSAFANNEISSLTLNEGVTTIGASAFANNPITTLEIPNSVTTIGASAFGGTQITELNMDNQPNPPSITSTTFPSTLEKIYVAYRDYDTYVAQWSDYADKIVRLPAIPSTITVIVNDYTGALVSGASVTISGNGQTYTGMTDSVGTFTQGDLQPATYTISVADMEGFKTPASSEVVVEEDTQNSVTVTYLEKPAQIPFAEATWQEISNIADEISRNNMTATEVEETYGWKLGDAKSETMSNGETIELQIIGFCHDRLVSGIGYAGITLQTVNCLDTIYKIDAKAESYEWTDCGMRLTTLPTIKSMFTQELQANIVPVNKVRGYDITEDELFLLSEQEVFGTRSDKSSDSSVDEGPQYAYWAEHNTPEDRVKSDWGWYLRTGGAYKRFYWCYVTAGGGIHQDNISYSKALSFALCLGSFERDSSKKSFSDYTPAEISEISSTIAANNMTNKQIVETYGLMVGDTTTIPLTTGENIDVRIIGFNHDNLSDGSGKAGITLQMVDTLKVSYSLNTPDSTKGGWGACQMRTTTMPSIKATLPQEWQDVIKLVDKKYANGTGSGYTETLTSSDDLFLLSAIELYGDRYTDTTAQAYNTEGSIYEYWKSNFALVYRKKKYDSDGDGTPETTRDWWLRSLANNYDPYWRLVKMTGGIDLTVPRFTRGVSFAFCV